MINKRILVLMFLLVFLPLVGCFPAPPNQAPIITSTPITTATVGVLYTYDVNATDPDGDTLTYSLITKPTSMTINSANGLIKWIPVAAQIGNNSVIVKVSDKSLSIIQSFTIKVSKLPVANQAPIIYSTPITTATVGVTYVYDVNATDPNGDTLTYSLTTYPSGMTISSASGLIMWTPTTKGNYAVVVKVSDGALTDTQSFTIKVSKPGLGLIGIKVVPKTMPLIVGESKTITSVTAKYSDGSTAGIALGSCTYSSSAPGVATVSKGKITAVAKGTATITVNYGGKSDTLKVTVSKPLAPPAELTSLWEDLDANLKPDFAPGVYEYSLAATDDEDKIVIAATLEGATIEYDYKHTKKGTVMGGCSLFVGKNIITITVKKGGYQTTTYTITVTKAGLPVNNVSIGRYYATIQEAITEADDSHTIYVSPGTYDKNIVINKALIIKSTDGAENTTIQGLSNNDYYLVYIQHSDVIFDGFTVIYPTFDGGSDVSGILVQNTGKPVSNVQVLNNIVTQVRSETGSPSSYGATGINIGTGPVDNVTISGNAIFDINNPIGVSNDHTCGINVWDGASNVVISYNTISDIKYNGIILEGASNVQIYENDITRCESGVRVNPRCGDVSNVQIEENDITGCEYGISVVPDAIFTFPLSDLTINLNNIYGNNTYGILNALVNPPVLIDATDNWWGHTSGPTHLLNPDGEGDAVSGNVIYISWSESPNF